MSRHSRGPVAAATLVAVGVVLTLTIGVLRLAGPPAGAQQTEDPALLRELAERLLSPLVAGAPQPRIFPGALPPDAPRDLIVPPGVRLVGSAELPRFGPPEQPATITITVIFDTSTTPDDIFAYYRDQLAATGWTPAPNFGPQATGFLPSQAGADSRNFCQGARGPSLNIAAGAGASGQTEVRLSYDASVAYGCFPTFGPPPPAIFTNIVPALRAPQGVQVRFSGSSSNPDSEAHDARANSDLSVGEIEALYAQQLSAAGWQRRDHAVAAALAWSTWAVPGGEGDRMGFLYVLDGPRAGERMLHVQVAPAPAPSAPGPIIIAPAPPAPISPGQTEPGIAGFVRP